jgi:hypothetical protein
VPVGNDLEERAAGVEVADSSMTQRQTTISPQSG